MPKISFTPPPIHPLDRSGGGIYYLQTNMPLFLFFDFLSSPILIVPRDFNLNLWPIVLSFSLSFTQAGFSLVGQVRERCGVSASPHVFACVHLWVLISTLQRDIPAQTIELRSTSTLSWERILGWAERWHLTGNEEVEIQVYLAETSGAGSTCDYYTMCFHIYITILYPPHVCLPISRVPREAGHTAGFPLLAVLYQSCQEVAVLFMWLGLK